MREAPPPAPRETPVAPVWALLLAPLGWLYRIAVILRAGLYRAGVLKTHRLSVPVISVGNLTAGGTGKTPVVEHLARSAGEAGLRPAVISRGYRRVGRSHLIRSVAAEGGPADAQALGDEPFWLTQRNPDLPVYVGKRRFLAGRLAEAVDAPGLILLDDGFQHLALGRELNLALIDAERGLGNGRMLPRGYLREPLAALGRADAVILTKANLGDAERIQKQLEPILARCAISAGKTGKPDRPAIPIFRFDYLPQRIERLDGGRSLEPAALAGAEVFLACAIAAPAGFAAAVTALGGRVLGMRALRDHDPYHGRTVAELDAALGDTPGEEPRWLTTEKDAVKLRGVLPRPERIWVLEMAVRPEPAWDDYFENFLKRTAAGRISG